MKRIIKHILTILGLAWNGAVTIFAGLIFVTAFFTVADKLFNNNLFACIIMSLVLVGVTLAVGAKVKEKIKEGK